MFRMVYVLLAVIGFFFANDEISAATPRDELLRVAPADTAIVVLVQNARTHYQHVSESPFLEWLPTTAIGKQLLGSSDLKQLHQSVGVIVNTLGLSPRELLDDVLGEAVLFAFSPAPPDRPTDDRAIILIRPRKPDVLLKLIGKVNEQQSLSGELKGIIRKKYEGVEYQERQKLGGGSEFYCFKGSVFAFSGIESEIKAFIDRDQRAAAEKEIPSELLGRLKKLGIADAAAVVLINPRALDQEVNAKLAGAKPEQKRFHARFAEVWTALDSAAIYLSLDKNIEFGASVRFLPGKLPADAKKWLTGPRNVTTAECLIPDRAMFGIAGQFRAIQLIDLIASLAPIEKDKPGVKEWIEGSLGPILGKDKLPLVMESLGPNWALWAEPPVEKGILPVVVAAVEITGDGEALAKSEKALSQAIEFGFQTARIAYNAKHVDQIEVKEEKNPRTGSVITTLINDKGFPPGFNPSFAIVDRYLVIASSPSAIRTFEKPALKDYPNPGYSTVAKFSGQHSREYLLANAPHLAKFLSDLGVGEEKTLSEQLGALASVLELIDTADVITRGDENGLRVAVRINTAKPLKRP